MAEFVVGLIQHGHRLDERQAKTRERIGITSPWLGNTQLDSLGKSTYALPIRGDTMTSQTGLYPTSTEHSHHLDTPRRRTSQLRQHGQRTSLSLDCICRSRQVAGKLQIHGIFSADVPLRKHQMHPVLPRGPVNTSKMV